MGRRMRLMNLLPRKWRGRKGDAAFNLILFSFDSIQKDRSFLSFFSEEKKGEPLLRNVRISVDLSGRRNEVALVSPSAVNFGELVGCRGVDGLLLEQKCSF